MPTTKDRLRKTLLTFLFAAIIYGLYWWLGFEFMVITVMIAWFTTIIDK